LTIPSSNKTKRHTGASHIVPLPAQAMAILRELHPLTGHGLGLKPDAPRYVFPTPKTKLRPLSENAVRQALRNMGFANDEMTRSLLAERGWKPDAIERQLSHKAAGPLGAAYDRAAFLDERKAMMQAWADHLDTLRERRNVVPLEVGAKNVTGKPSDQFHERFSCPRAPRSVPGFADFMVQLLGRELLQLSA
jgi:hypothetical protein